MMRRAVIALSLALAACQTIGLQEETCAPDDLRQSCLMDDARLALAQVTDAPDSVDAAQEMSFALAAMGEEAAAIDVLKAAALTAEQISDPTKRAAAYLTLGKAAADLRGLVRAQRYAELAQAAARHVEAETKRIDLLAKANVLKVRAGQPATAQVMGLVDDPSGNAASFQARALQEIAVAHFQAGRTAQARDTLPLITMGLPYYQAKARSEMAMLAAQAGPPGYAKPLLKDALPIANEMDNGYFKAGALRDIAAVWHELGEVTVSRTLFEEAAKAATTAPSAQERARAISRLSAVLSDRRLYDQARALLPLALAQVEQEERQVMRDFSLYEIAGAAAFAGDFETAFSVLEDIPDTKFSTAASLYGATQRDIAWGLARHDRLTDAAQLARQIADPRLRAIALSRVIRIMNAPNMTALPRYL